MTKEEIMGTVRGLATSQGMYGRLLEALENDEDLADRFADQYADCGDAVDFVMRFEGG